MTSGLVYIDESGNLGATGGASDYFVMAAIVVGAEDAIEIETKMSEVKRQLRLGINSEFKFSKMNKNNVKLALESLRDCRFSVYAAVHRKDKLYTDCGQNTYNNILLRLLKTIELDTCNVDIDGKVGKAYRKQTKTFIRKNLPNTHIKHFRFTDSRSSNLIQLADLAAGAIGRSFASKPDAQEYIRILKPKIRRVTQE